MDSTEDDISARVLLRRVLHTELPRSPVTRSATNVRRSMRLKNTPGLESPGSALRHRLKKKLHESASLSPLPSPKRQRSTVANTNPPVTAPSPVYDEDITTRGLLRGIIQMETEASLLMSGQPALQESEPNPAESSAGERTEGLSGVELSDLTLHTEPLTHVVRGLSRKKPQHVFSVSAFEEQFDQLPDNTEDTSNVFHKGDVSQAKGDASQDLDVSSGSKSGLNLTLKTPFVEKRIERAGLQRKVSHRRLQSVDAFDEAVQRCLEQGPNQDQSVFQDGKTLEDSSWQKFTLGLSDVTELYVHSKKDDTMGPSAENERASDIPDSEPLIQEEKDHEMESQDQEEVVPPSQDNVYLSAEDIVLAPTQAMTESLPESHDVELQDREFVEEVEIGNVVEIEYENIVETEDQEVVEIEDDNIEEIQDEHVEEVEDENSEEVKDENAEEVKDENAEEVEDENAEEVENEEVIEAEHEHIDTSQYLERITRRAHRSEGGGAVLGIPGTSRVTKSFGAGLNPREKDLLDFVDEGRVTHQDIPGEEREALGSPEFPLLHPAAELSTPEQRSLQHEASLPEEDVPELAEDDDAQEEPNQSEEEELMDSEPANHSPEFPQDEEEEEDDDDDALSAELSMKTPAFVRQKRVFASRTAQTTPTVLKEVNSGPAPQVAKRAPRQKRQTGVNVLPKSYVMSVFKHFTKTKVASDVYPAINEILKKYFERLADDLEAYATHAKRKTIEVEDFELLMRRQGFVTDTTPVNILIEKYLPMEYRKLLIPVATSGNKVIPKQRR
ncbi:centromere protein T [Carassius carassius]|uniref:centromere protein T n=1 Tax=Carassius carassius TaxID=217509 RepID=UPI0028691889|nr:centromere protein T [Carassius carassius]